MCEYILFFNRFFVFASLWSWFFCVWGLCVCVYVYGLDFSCVRFMSVLSRLDLCYSFCFCLLTVLLLSFWWQVPADRAKRPTRLFQPFHFFSLLHFPLFQTFPLHAFYTFWREGKGEERRPAGEWDQSFSHYALTSPRPDCVTIYRFSRI